MFFFCSLWTLDLIAKYFLYGLLLWAFLKFTGLHTFVSRVFKSNDNQGFLKEA